MMTAEKTSTSDRIDTVLQAFETGDAAAAASMYADDGVFIHPQYPEAEYHGRESIRGAFEWGFTNLVDRPRFTVRHFLEEDDTCAVEVITHYVGSAGSEHECPQVFVVEGGPDGIARWQTYLPFPPEWLKNRRA